MASRESLEDFLTPTTPTKRSDAARSGTSSSATDQHQQPPDSPSKQLARSRLGNLLGQIRKGDAAAYATKDGGGVEGVSGRLDEHQQQLREMEADFEDELGGRHGARRHHVKKLRREKRVVFELRGKPFGLRDCGHSETVYALCRKWMYGKDDEPPTEEQDAEGEQQQTEDGGNNLFDMGTHRSLDLLATKNIFALPPPRPDAPPLLDPRPQRLIRRVDDQQAMLISAKEGDMNTVLDEHLKHWKRVKQNWNEYSRKREQRYADSLQLLRTVYGIAQQTQQM
uniref:Rxt2-like protein n=1 Tax=Globodera pallida TaxID=36090 RepID=A0A183C0V1_GLOPA